MRLLLVEDNLILGDGVQAGLVQSGLGVDWAKNLGDARLAVATAKYEGIILDLGLPDGSGLTFLSQLRKDKNHIPVLILTAKDTLQDKIKGLDTGADDYLVKPFELDELTARIRSMLRRSHSRTAPVISHSGIELDPEARTVSIEGHPVDLPQKEFTLLEYLLENTGRVLSRAQLEQCLYGWNADVESNAIEVHVHHLRKKFGTNLIKTIRGVGYLIEKKRSE